MDYDGIRNLKEAYELKNNDFINYYVIGDCDSGSICIDANCSDQIFAIDTHHVYNIDSKEEADYHEAYVPVMFMNTSVEHLAHCILVYHIFINKVRAVRNQQSFLEIQFTEQELSSLKGELRVADNRCLAEKSFWWFEISGLTAR